jgi:hypothetical protein
MRILNIHVVLVLLLIIICNELSSEKSNVITTLGIGGLLTNLLGVKRLVKPFNSDITLSDGKIIYWLAFHMNARKHGVGVVQWMVTFIFFILYILISGIYEVISR